MRKLIASMKVSLDGKVEGIDGIADWVEGWSEGFGLTPQIDACVLGGGMYPGYEGYWSAIQNAPDQVHPMTGTLPTRAEVEWAEGGSRLPHYVLSNTLSSARWPQTTFLRRLEDITALREQPGKGIYLIGGARTTSSLIDAGLVDELRLIVYPLIAGRGKALFATTEVRRKLTLLETEPTRDGRVMLTYEIG